MHFIMRKKPDLCKKKEFPSDIRKVNCEQCVVISMYDENRKFTKLVMFMAEKYYSNNLETKMMLFRHSKMPLKHLETEKHHLV